MLPGQMANGVAFEAQPCSIPVSNTPVTIKAPFFLTYDTPLVCVLCEGGEVVDEVAKIMGGGGFSCDIVFSLLVNGGATIRCRFGL